MLEWASERLRLCAGLVTDWAALHENNGMVPVPASYSGGKSKHKLRSCFARHRLKTHRRQVMALVDNQMSVVRHQISHDITAHQTLQHGHVNHTAGIAFTASNPSDCGVLKIEKSPELHDPLVHELSPMHEHQRVYASFRNHRRRDNSFAESCCRSENASLVLGKSISGTLLFLRQRTEEVDRNLLAGIPLIRQLEVNAEFFEQLPQGLSAPARQDDVMGLQLGAGDHAGNPESGASHRLRPIELWILKGRKANDPVYQSGWQPGSWNIELVRQDNCNLVRKLTRDCGLILSPGRRGGPGLQVFLLQRQTKAHDPTLPTGRIHDFRHFRRCHPVK